MFCMDGAQLYRSCISCSGVGKKHFCDINEKLRIIRNIIHPILSEMA